MADPCAARAADARGTLDHLQLEWLSGPATWFLHATPIMKALVRLLGATAAGLAVVPSAGCGRGSPGVTSMQPDASVPAPEPDVWVTLRRAPAQCGTPPDCGWMLHVVNRREADVHVDTIDLGHAGLGSTPPEVVTDAPDGEVVLRGYLERGSVFVAGEVWRGLPGEGPSPSDVYAQIATGSEGACEPGVCERGDVIALGLGLAAAVRTVDLSGIEVPRIDRGWLRDRVLRRGAVVAGHFGGDPSEPVISRFDVTQVFVAIPDRVRPCRAPALRCRGGTEATFTRDLDGCLVPKECMAAGRCSEAGPVSCTPGYVLRSWRGSATGCAEYACDPGFLPE